MGKFYINIQTTLSMAINLEEEIRKREEEEREKERQETDKTLPEGSLEELSPCCKKPLVYTGKEYPTCSCCKSDVIVDYCS